MIASKEKPELLYPLFKIVFVQNLLLPLRIFYLIKI